MPCHGERPRGLPVRYGFLANIFLKLYSIWLCICDGTMVTIGLASTVKLTRSRCMSCYNGGDV